ncbi:hypothetical protein GCM10027569_47680 [Flindersiella endophytica]
MLAFDASCARCQAVSRAVERASQHRLEVHPLADDDVKRWRAQALGPDAAWAPTLIRVRGGGRARAWTGLAMGARLVRRLGPAATVRLLRALSDLRRTTAAESGRAAGTLGRKGFLRLGAGIGMAAGLVLAGNGTAFADELTTARGWVRANADRLPHRYDDVVAHPVAYRRAIFEALPADVRSRLWVEHLRRYGADYPGLSAKQAGVLDRARAVAGRVSMFEPGDRSEALAQARDVRQAAIDAFGKDEARRILATLGPADRSGVAGGVRPQVADCECSEQSDWCAPDFNCTDCSWNCCDESSWGCGDYYAYPCDGICR